MRIGRIVLILLILIISMFLLIRDIPAEEQPGIQPKGSPAPNPPQSGQDKPGDEQLWEELNKKALQLYKDGKYEEAEKVVRQSLEIAEKKYGAEHHRTGTSLNNLAMLYKSQGRYSDAEPLYKRSLAIFEKILGKEHLGIAICLNNLASLYQLQGKYADAEPLFKRALEIREKIQGKEHPDTVAGLDNLASIYKLQGKYSSAEPLYRRALEINEKLRGKEHPDTAYSLNNLAELYREQGRYSDAEPLYKRALEIYEKVLGKEHSNTAIILSNLGCLYRDQGRYSDAEPLLKRGADITEKVLGKEHLNTALCLNNLVCLYSAQGRYAEAEPLSRRALAIKEKVLGKENPSTAISLNNLASLYQSQGRYSDAEPLYNRALEISEKVPGKEHPNTATCLDNLAGIYLAQGRHAEAEPLYRRGLEIREKVFGKEHPDTAISLNNLALLYYNMNRYSEAEPLYKRALAIQEKVLGKEHPDIALSLNNLALLYNAQGRYSETEPLYKRALAIREKVLGKESPDTAVNLVNLGTLYSAEGRFREAEQLYRRALAIWEKVLGKEHPDAAWIMNNLASLYAKTGRIDEAFQISERADKIDEKTILDVFRTSSENQKFEFLATVQENYEAFLSLIIKDLPNKPNALTSGLDTVLKRKGIVLEAISKERELILKSEKPEVRDTYRKLSGVSAVLSSLVLAGPGSMKMEEYRQRLDELRKEREELEKKLTGMSSEFALREKTRSANCKTVSEKLPSGSVLVEYVNLRPYNFKAKKWGEPEFCAFILPSSKDMPSGEAVSPKLVPLGKASEIDNAVNIFRKEISRTRTLWQDGILDEAEAEKRLAEKGKQLYSLVVAPIKNAVGDAKTLYIAPDGDLNLIPFGALQDETGRYLLENYRVNYLSSGRDLMGFDNKTDNNGKTLIIADPDYEMTGSDRVAASKTLLSANEQKEQMEQVALRGESRSRDLSLTKWNRLPGTRKEADEIREILKGDNPKEFTDKSALEEIMKEVRSPRRLHIATHGFFMEDQDDMELLKAGTRGQTFMSAEGSFSGVPVKIENPLLRCGLVLAGANRMGTEKLPEGCDDGILTALEITGIPLAGTDLVVLSACETGVGKTKCGEGVFGLRRAFQLAGARTVVMSLWSVPDKQTQELMTDYYQRMKNDESKSEALRNAKLAMMKSRREETGSSHPFFWASFISVGEP